MVCVVHSSVLAWISSVHIDKVLAWLSFRKIYVLKASLGVRYVMTKFSCFHRLPIYLSNGAPPRASPSPLSITLIFCFSKL